MQIIDEVLALGWMFNNCYQRDDGSWRINLRRPDLNSDGDWFTDWAEAPTFSEALEDCMSKLHNAEYSPTPPITTTQGVKLEAKSGRSLLQSLGLSTPTTHNAVSGTLTRRA